MNSSAATIDLGMYRDSKFFDGGVGVGLSDSAPPQRTCYQVCYLINVYTACKCKCVCQPQIVYVCVASGGCPQTPTGDLPLDPAEDSRPPVPRCPPCLQTNGLVNVLRKSPSLRQARLVLGRVTAYRQVNHLGMLLRGWAQ